MNRTIVQLRILWLMLFMLSAFAVNALTLNPLIEAPAGHRMMNQQPLLFNNQIIFVTEKNSDYSLWAYDLTDNSYTTLQNFEQFNVSQELHVIDGFFYFRDFNEPSRVWRSDGTPSGTIAVPGLITFKGSHLQPQNNLLFAQWGGEDTNTDIVGFDGESYRKYGVEHHPNEKAVCAFSLNDVIIPSTNVFVGNERHLVRYTGQNSIDYTSNLPEGFRTHENKVWQFGNNCFYFITSQATEQYFYDVFVIPENGDTFFLGERIAYSHISQIIHFKNNFYAIGLDAEGVDKLIKLSLDLSQVLNEVESHNSLYFKEFRISNDFLIVQEYSGGSASPPVFYTGYYNDDLEHIENLGGYLRYLPEIYPTAQGETIYFKNQPVFGGDSQNILATDITNKADGLVIKGQILEHVITAVNNTQTYTLMRDFTSRIYSINHLQQLPNMGSLSVGNWYNPDYQSQGMSIVEGLRDDGTRYLFVTLYLFRDGQPLWLAGTSNINYPQSTLDIELGEYSGLGLWQADTPAHVEKFADMTLSMSSCHQMMMHIETLDGQTFNIGLQRMVNNDINQYCKD